MRLAFSFKIEVACFWSSGLKGFAVFFWFQVADLDTIVLRFNC